MSQTEKRDYMYLFDKFEDNAIPDRYYYVATKASKFVNDAGISEEVVLNELQMGEVIIDYFADIARLKDFHDIEHANSVKRTAYMSYWILRNKPLQIIKGGNGLQFINERFVLTLIIHECIGYRKPNSYSEQEKENVSEFIKAVFYFFRYRHYDAQILEVIIDSFKLGMRFGSSI